LVERIVDAVQPLRVVLFGSAARGTAGSESDIDLLIVMPEGTHRRHTAQHLYRVLAGVGTPFDLIVATPGDLERQKDNVGLVYYSILREGRTIDAA
jgi:predicted nucleotidyltransferase